MWTLFKKEWTYLKPVAVLFAIFWLLDIPYYFLSRASEGDGWTELRFSNSEDNFYLTYFLGFTLAYCMYAREYEEKTIDFLHTLPVTRSKIFIAKITAGLALILSVLLGAELGFSLLQMVTSDSLSAWEYRPANTLRFLGVSLVSAFVGLCHGMLLSLARGFGVLLWFMILFCLSGLAARYPEYQTLDLGSMGAIKYQGWDMSPDLGALGTHLGIGLVCLYLAHRAWTRHGHQSTNFFHRIPKRYPRAVGCLVVGLVVIVAVLGSLLAPEEKVEVSEDPLDYASKRVNTEHYQFLVPLEYEQKADKVAAFADEVYEKVEAELGEAGTEAKISADLTNISNEHLGIAAANNIRMDLSDNDDLKLLEYVLCHETTHVFANRLAGRRGTNLAHELSTFHEGTASYFGYKLTEAKSYQRHSRLVAAALYQRHKLKFREILRAGPLQARLNDGSIYSLGEVWVEALVRCYGPESPRKVWASFDRKVRNDLRGRELWLEAFASQGYDLNRVSAEWTKILQETLAQEKTFFENLPKLSGEVVAAEREGFFELELRLDKELPEEWPSPVASIREKAGESGSRINLSWDSERKAWIGNVPQAYGKDFEFQFGLRIFEAAYPIVDEWRSQKRAPNRVQGSTESSPEKPLGKVFP